MITAFERLVGSSLTSTCPTATEDQIDGLRWRLPPSHRSFLRLSNGLSVYHGVRRLFGTGCEYCRDIGRWNHTDVWKFAWNTDLSKFLCFAETGWGDQYAYHLDDLNGNGDAKVYRLEYIDMSPRLWNQNFDEFVTNELLRWIADPYDPDAVAAVRRLGPLAWDEQMAYAPPVVIGGSEDVSNALKVPAVTNMIYSGDLFSQVCEIKGAQTIAGLERYSDDRGRGRIRLMLTHREILR